MTTDGNPRIKIPLLGKRQSPEQKESEKLNAKDTAGIETECEETTAVWRDTALRLKADMVNYRKRQERWAQDEVQREKDRLLISFVGVLDNLEQAVIHLDPSSVTHQGVKIAYDQMLQLIAREGVERIDVQDAPFDPLFHEAVAMVPALKSQSFALQVSDVVNHGYRIGDRVLVPSRVIVAKR